MLDDVIRGRMKKKEYESLYVDFCERACLEDVKGREIFVIYDEILPDMYVNIGVDGKYVNAIDYDIYANRLRSVSIGFPNDERFIYKITRVRVCERHDRLYDLKWEEPMIVLNLNGLEIEVSIIDLISQSIKVYLNDYSFEKEYLDE